jgi:transglutaminase-like putative cysteine protease
MLIRSEFDIQFHLAQPAPTIALLHLHPSVERYVRSGNTLLIEHLPTPDTPDSCLAVPSTEYRDGFGNRCTRFVAPVGRLRLSGSSILEVDPVPDPVPAQGRQIPVEELPDQILQFLLPSRYCEVDRFVPIAQDLFGHIPAGWARAAAIRDWVHWKVAFNYQAARPTKTAMDVFTERIGVCRDFQHLAITLSRCQNIPARYVTGYLGDIRWPYGGPGDFSAWYEVFLDDRWWTMDARHSEPRLGRILMATGRDAADVAITTSFGFAPLHSFKVESNEIWPDGTPVPLPATPGEAHREPPPPAVSPS